MAVESVMIPQLSNGEETANENEPGSSAQGPARKNKGKINPWNAFLMQMRSKGVKDVKTIRMLYRNLSSEELTQLKQWSEQFNRGEECPLLQPETIEPRQIGCPNTGEVLETDEEYKKCVVRGGGNLLKIATINLDIRARVFFDIYTQDLLELEAELDRVCSHEHKKLVPQELFPGFACIAYDSKLGIFARCEVNEVFFDNEQTVNCFSLDYGHKFSTTINDIRPLPKALAEGRLPYRTCYIYLSTVAVKDMKLASELKFDFEDFLSSKNTVAEFLVTGFDRNFNFCGDVKLENEILLSSTLSKIFNHAILTVDDRLQFRNRVFSEIESLKLPKELDGSNQSELLFSQIRNLKVNPKVELKSYRENVGNEVKAAEKLVCEHQQWDELYDLINLNDIPSKSDAELKLMKVETSKSKSDEVNFTNDRNASFKSGIAETESGSSPSYISSQKSLNGGKRKRKTIQELKKELELRKKKQNETKEEPRQKLVPDIRTLTLKDVDFSCEVEAKMYRNLDEEGYDSTFHEQAFLIGLFRKPWGSCDEIVKNLGRWKYPPRYYSILASYAFPLAIQLSCDLVGIHTNRDQRVNFFCNLIIYGQTARIFRTFEDEEKNKFCGINMQGPIVVIVVPTWKSVLYIDSIFREQVSGFKKWRPNVKCDYGWGESMNCHVLVTTPSRLSENLMNDKTNFNRMKYFVIEEADTVFEKFPDKMAECVRKLKKQRNQSMEHDWRLLIFGESFHPKIERFLGIRGLKDPEYKRSFSAIFTDLFEASLFVGATHYPVVCKNEEDKMQKVCEIVRDNQTSGSVFAIVCRQDDSCHQLAVKFDDSYDVICFINEEVQSRLNAERSSRRNGVAIVIGTDKDLVHMLSVDASATFLISFEPPMENLECETSIGQRCVLLNETLAQILISESGSSLSMPKIFHLISPEDSIQYLALLWKKFAHRVLQSHLDESFYSNFESLIQAVLLEQESTKNGMVELCPNMMVNPCHNPKNSEMIRCTSLICNMRHIILPSDKPGSDVRVTDIPSQGYCRVRIRAVLGANFYSATIEHYRKTQNENFVPYCVETMRKIEDEIEDMKLVPIENSDVKTGRLYLVKHNGILRRCVVREFVKTNEYGHPSSVSVFRIDAGDILNPVLVSSLYQIPIAEKSLRRIPGQAIRVILTGIAPVDGSDEFTPEICKYVEEKLFGKLLEAMIVSSIGQYLFVHLLTLREKLVNGEWCSSGYRIKNDLLERNYCVKNDNQMFLLEKAVQPILGDVPSLKSVLAATDNKHHESDTLEVGVYVPVFINPNFPKTSPAEFFVIKQSSYKEIFELQRVIGAHSKQYKPKLQVENGQFAIAQVKNRSLTEFEVSYLEKCKENASETETKGTGKFYVDAPEWFRVRVIDVNVIKKMAVVFLLDFGEAHEVKISKLRQCPPDIFTVPGAAICCSLSDVKPVETEYGFKPQVRNLMKELSKTRELTVYADEEKCAHHNVRKETSSIKTPVKLYYKGSDNQNQSFYDFSLSLCTSGYAVGSRELMCDVFKSILKDQFLKLHADNGLNEDVRYEMLSSIWEDYTSSTSAKMSQDIFCALLIDFSFIIRSYQSVKMLEKCFEIMVQLAEKGDIPEQIGLVLVEITFTCSKLSFVIVRNFITLLNMTKFSQDSADKVCLTIAKELGKTEMEKESIVVLLEFLDSKCVWKMACEDSIIAILNRMFKTLMRKHTIADMNVLYKIFLWCMKEEQFSYRTASTPLELSLVLKQYKPGVPLEHKYVLTQIINQFMKFDSCKFRIANTNSFVEALKHDAESIHHIIKAYQMKKLLGSILEYKKEKMEEVQNSVRKRPGMSSNNDVRDLRDTQRDLSEYQKLTPKVSWWQSDSFISITVEIFGVKEKQIDYTSNSISFKAFTLEDKYYCFQMKLFGEIVTESPNSVLESFSGRQIQIRMNKKEAGMWDKLTVERMNNLVYNAEQMLNVDGVETEQNSFSWMTYRSPGVLKNVQPDFGYGRSSDSQYESSNSTNLSVDDLDLSDMD